MEWLKPKAPVKEVDELYMYFVVNRDLEMGCGKIGAQCAHAVQLALLEEKRLRKIKDKSATETNILLRMEYWCDRRLNAGFNKIVLGADKKEWLYIKEVYNPITVADAGRTEVAPGSETVMILWPMFKNERCKTLSRMRLL